MTEMVFRRRRLPHQDVAFVDNLLDHESAVRHLEDDSQAEIVQNSFLHFVNDRYKLLAFVVIPSHHHWLFLPDEA